MADSPRPRKTLFDRFQELLAVSRFLTVSVFLHMFLVITGGSAVLFKQYVEPPDFMADGSLLTSDEVTTNVADPVQPLEPTPTFTPEAPIVLAPSIAALTTTSITPSFKMEANMPTIKAPPTDLKAMISNAPKVAAATKGPVGVPATMGARLGGKARSMAMMMNGGKKEGEEAVMKGLRFLVTQQNPDGSWARGTRPTISAMTGLSLLSFLGHGETPVSTEFGPAVQKALDFLMAGGTKNDGRLAGEPTFTQTGVYAHGIATYALGEYYTMTKDERVVEVLKKAITHIVKGQSSDGGWRYAYLESNNPDTSVTGWQIQALKAAHLTGLNVEGVDAALDKSMIFLRGMQGPKGGYGYDKPGDGYSLAGAGVLCTYFWKQDKDPSVRAGISFIMEQTRTNFPVDYKAKDANLYAWYYNTQACLMMGGAPWATWNRLFQDQLIKNQLPDGSWPPVTTTSPGDLKEPGGYGPIYRTNLCVLMLEVYYRYMPTTR